jgi:hypothetical protein
MIYPNQKKAGKQILSVFAKYSKYVILVAQMQSGKTGTCKYVTKKLIKKHGFLRNNCWYICGMNDNDLLNQTREEFKKILPSENILYSKGLQKKNCEDIIVIREPILVIVDESHYAGYINSQVDLFLTKMLDNDEIYILSVSATPMAEIVSSKELNKKIITLIPDEGYYGLYDIYKSKLLFQSANISTDFEAFSNDIIAEYERQRATKKWKYCIIRLPNYWYTSDMSRDIKELCNGISFINCHYTETVTDDEVVKTIDFNNFVAKAPKKMTIIWIYNSLRAGKQLNTKNIGMVYDNATSGTDTTAQSLLGRILGYHKKDDKVRCYCNLESAKRMLSWISAGFSVETVPIKSRGIIAKALHQNNWVQHIPIIVKLTECYSAHYRELKLKNGNRYPYKNSLKSAIIESVTISGDFSKDMLKQLSLIFSDEYHDGRYGGLMILTEHNADRSFKEHWESNYTKSKSGQLIRGFEVGAEQITAECNKFCYIFVNLHKYSKSYGKCIICYKEYCDSFAYTVDDAEADVIVNATYAKVLPCSRYRYKYMAI